MFAGYPIEIKNGGDIRFFETDNANYVGFVAPAVIAADKLWTLPNADGSANYYLKTNGTAVLSFAQIQGSEIGGTLAVANGGTGTGTFTANGVLYGNTISALQVTDQGGSNTVLIANAGAPSFSGQPTLATGVITKGQEAVRLDPHGVAAGNTGELRFLELAANGTHYFGLKAPDSLVASTVYVLPTAFPAANGYVLTSTTAGVLAWAVNGAPPAFNLSEGTGISISAGSGIGALLVAATLAINQAFTPAWTGLHTWRMASSTAGAIYVEVTGDAETRFTIDASGRIDWSDGAVGADATLRRTAAGVLEVTNIVNAVTGFRVNNGASNGNVLKGNGTNFVSAAAANLSPGTGISISAGSGTAALLVAATLAVDQTFAPTWTGLHEWKINNAATGGRIVLSYDNTAVLTGDVFGSIDFKSYDATASCAGIVASVRALAHVSFTANPSTDLILCVANTTADIDNPVERFRLDSTGKVLIGTGGVTFGGLSVTQGLGNTVARFGDGSAGDVCAIPRMGSAGAPALAFNAYFDSAWKFGKGSNANYGQVFGGDQSNGTFTWYVSNATGNADAAMTLTTLMSLSRTGVLTILSPLAAGQGGTGVATASANTFFGGPTSGGVATPSFRVLDPADLPGGFTAGLLRRTASTNYTVLSSDYIIISDTGGAGSIDFTLPVAGIPHGKVYIVRRVAGDTVVVKDANGNTLDTLNTAGVVKMYSWHAGNALYYLIMSEAGT